MDEELEKYLGEQHAAGSSESTGVFTLSPQQAIEKMAAYSLPWEYAWVLKIVQAIVAAGASSLDVYVSNTEIQFRFPGRAPWTLDEVERALLHPSAAPQRSLEHLKRGVWSCLHQHQTFIYGAIGSRVALSLSRDGSTRPSLSPNDFNLIMLTHAHKHSAAELMLKGILPLPGSESFAQVGPTREQLAKYCYASPIPIRMDGERYDNLLASTTHGYAAYGAAPVRVLACHGDLPVQNYRVQVSTAWVSKQDDPLKIPSPLRSYFFKDVSETVTASVTCLLALLITDFQATKFESARSQIHFVLDGVIVHSRELPMKRTRLSVAIYVSAEGLPTDISGLQLVQGAELDKRIRKATHIADSELQILEAPSLKVASTAKMQKGCRALAGLSLVGAVAFHPLAIVSGVFLVLSLMDDPDGTILPRRRQEAEVRAELPVLKKMWSAMREAK